MTRRLNGLIAPITTPFDAATGDVAPVHLRDNARALLDVGVNGLVAAGSTGEAPLLGEDEFRDILGWLRDVVPDDKWLIAGAGRESTRAAVAACRVAAEEHADAVLVRAPSYYAPSLSHEALVNHFRRIADESPVPVLLYNMPKYTHVELADSLFAALCDHQNIWGAKDSSGDLKNFASYRAAVPDWALLIGSGGLYYSALELGAAGAVAATACFAPRETCEIGNAYEAGDRRRSGALQEKIAPLHRGIVGDMGIAGVKAAMDATGLYGGPARPPLLDLDARAKFRLKTMLSEAGVTTD